MQKEVCAVLLITVRHKPEKYFKNPNTFTGWGVCVCVRACKEKRGTTEALTHFPTGQNATESEKEFLRFK